MTSRFRRAVPRRQHAEPEPDVVFSPPEATEGPHPLRGSGPAVHHWIAEGRIPTTTAVREAMFRRVLVVADTGATMAAGVAVSILADGRLRPLALLIIPFVLVAEKLAGSYDRDELLLRKATTLEEVPRLFYVATLVALLVAILGELLVTPSLGSVGLLTLWLGLFIFSAAFRAAGRAYALRHTATERCLVVGDADACATLADRLRHSPYINSEIVGYVPLHPGRSEDPPPLGTLEQLDRILDAKSVERVIVAPRDTDSDTPLDVVRRVKVSGVRVSVLPRIFEVVGTSIEFDDIDSLTLLGIRRFGLSRAARVSKRALDLVGATAAVVLALPLMLVCAVAVRLDSPGPVLFRQRRVGLEGKVFEIIKFRTMVADAEARKAALAAGNETEGLFKMADDPRITRVGRWLRRTSLDELPQLFNVLRGAMSLVGPRPLVLDEDRRVEGWHRRRLHLKPGMTGPWQILTSGQIPLYEMVKIDYLYVATWSLWVDIKILLRTIPYVLAHRGM